MKVKDQGLLQFVSTGSFRNDIALQIKEIRKIQGKSQKDVAREAGVAERTVRNLEKGNECTVSVLEKVCEAIGCTPVIYFELHSVPNDTV